MMKNAESAVSNLSGFVSSMSAPAKSKADRLNELPSLADGVEQGATIESLARELAKVKKVLSVVKSELTSLVALHEIEAPRITLQDKVKSGTVIYYDGKTKKRHDGMYGIELEGDLKTGFKVRSDKNKARIKGYTVPVEGVKFDKVPSGTWCLVTNKTGLYRLVDAKHIIPADAEYTA